MFAILAKNASGACEMIPVILFGIVILSWIGYVGWFIYKYSQHVEAERQEQITWRERRNAEWEERKKKWSM